MLERCVPRTLAAIALLSTCLTPFSSVAEETGKELFDKVCAACHTIGGGRRVGPDLAGVLQRRSSEWITAFVKSPQAAVDSHDPMAIKLVNEFNGMVMPPAPYNDEQIRTLVKFIGAAEHNLAAAPPPQEVPERKRSAADIQKGQQLFQGIQRLERGGVACNACHHVNSDSILAGGTLALELTSSFDRMGAEGIEAIISSPPFPVMQRAYRDRPLSSAEVQALIAFLEAADKKQAAQAGSNPGIKMATGGVGGFVGLMVLYSLIWGRRKVRSVNHDIYARQSKSL